jgi:hypothetical protein
VLYGAGDVDKAPIDAALSEMVFHDLPIRGSKHLAHAQLVHRLGAALVARRDLLLVDLTSDGLRRLGLTRGELIESDSRSYPQTAAWAGPCTTTGSGSTGCCGPPVNATPAGRCSCSVTGSRSANSPSAPGQVRLILGAGEGLQAVCAAADRAGLTLCGLTRHPLGASAGR